MSDTCSTCRFWAAPEDRDTEYGDEWGSCANAPHERYRDYFMRVESVDGFGWLETRHDFGCIAHAPRPVVIDTNTAARALPAPLADLCGCGEDDCRDCHPKPGGEANGR